MANPFVSGRVSPPLYERLEAYCNETGLTKSEVLVSALSAHLGVEEPENSTKARSVDLKTVEGLLAPLKLQLLLLENKMNNLLQSDAEPSAVTAETKQSPSRSRKRDRSFTGG